MPTIRSAAPILSVDPKLRHYAGRCGRRSENLSVRRDDFGVEARAVLRRPPLRSEIDMHDAEALGVTERPLEVVEQRPREVAAQIDALLDGARGSRQCARVR